MQLMSDAWSGEGFAGDRIPAWDAAHIYTSNGLTLLDMLGRGVGVDENRLRADLRVATERCLDTYGCRHSSYTPRPEELDEVRHRATVRRPGAGAVAGVRRLGNGRSAGGGEREDAVEWIAPGRVLMPNPYQQ